MNFNKTEDYYILLINPSSLKRDTLFCEEKGITCYEVPRLRHVILLIKHHENEGVRISEAVVCEECSGILFLSSNS
jgi:hypothetical protein